MTGPAAAASLETEQLSDDAGRLDGEQTPGWEYHGVAPVGGGADDEFGVEPAKGGHTPSPGGSPSTPGQGGRDALDHCPACTVRRQLLEHRDQTAAAWSLRRGVLNFAAVLARRACPDYAPATTSTEEA